MRNSATRRVRGFAWHSASVAQFWLLQLSCQRVASSAIIFLLLTACKKTDGFKRLFNCKHHVEVMATRVKVTKLQANGQSLAFNKSVEKEGCKCGKDTTKDMKSIFILTSSDFFPFLSVSMSRQQFLKVQGFYLRLWGGEKKCASLKKGKGKDMMGWLRWMAEMQVCEDEEVQLSKQPEIKWRWQAKTKYNKRRALEPPNSISIGMKDASERKCGAARKWWSSASSSSSGRVVSAY